MIATTPEKSKRLLELGLDPNTADMVWMCNKWLYSIKDNILNQEQFSEQDTLAWSLSALLEVMPKEHMPTLSRFGNNWFMGSLARDSAAYNTPIEAAYSQVCWLLEQGLIKKGDNDEGDRRKTSTY